MQKSKRRTHRLCINTAGVTNKAGIAMRPVKPRTTRQTRVTSDQRLKREAIAMVKAAEIKTRGRVSHLPAHVYKLCRIKAARP